MALSGAFAWVRVKGGLGVRVEMTRSLHLMMLTLSIVVLLLGASSGSRSVQRARKRPAGSVGLSPALRRLPPAPAAAH